MREVRDKRAPDGLGVGRDRDRGRLAGQLHGSAITTLAETMMMIFSCSRGDAASYGEPRSTVGHTSSPRSLLIAALSFVLVSFKF
jgi:hypothetical protein